MRLCATPSSAATRTSYSGATKAEVWRNESYQLKAKIAGTIEGSHIDLHPKVEAGSLTPVFEIIGSDEWGTIDYEIGSCVVGDVLSSEFKTRDTDPPIVDYEADLFSLGACWTPRHGDPTEAEWLSEWYLNGPHLPHMYPRGSATEFKERYERERKLPGNEEDNFEEIKHLGGARFAFVESDGLSFLVQHTPKNLGPSWSGCLSIEYRPVWGGIPDANVREAIAAITSFLMGRELVNVGHTSFAADGLPVSQVAINPQKDNLMSLCQRDEMRTP